MTQTKRFDLGTMLSVTTGRLLTTSNGQTDNGIGDIYELLGWMTNDQPFTHQLGRFAQECKPWLLRWFPQLATANDLLPLLDEAIQKMGPDRGCNYWLDGLTFERFFDVPRIPTDDHVQKDAYDEMVEMRGTDEGIVLFQPESKPDAG